MVYYISKKRIINRAIKKVINEDSYLLGNLKDPAVNPILIWSEYDGYRARYYDEDKRRYYFNDVPEDSMSKLFDWAWE